MNDESSDKIEFITLTNTEIFLKIWTSPRLVFQFVEEHRFEKFMLPLLFLHGVGTAIGRSIDNSSGDTMSLTMILALSVVLGGSLGWLSLYIGSGLMSWTGKWLKGKGNTKSLLRMSAHAVIPGILMLVFYIPFIILFDIRLFQNDFGFFDGEDIALFTLGVIQIILSVWIIVIYLTGVSVVQKFSVGKAFLNVLFSFLVIAVPILLLALIVDSVSLY